MSLLDVLVFVGVGHYQLRIVAHLAANRSRAPCQGELLETAAKQPHSTPKSKSRASANGDSEPTDAQQRLRAATFPRFE